MGPEQHQLPTITAEQRDALYAQVLDHLSGIDDLRLAFQQKNFGIAARLAREFDDDLRLILGDLGWGDHGGQDNVQLTTPAPILRRVLEHQRRRATEQLESEIPELEELRTMTERAEFVQRTCDQLLGELDGEIGRRDGR